LYELTGVSLKTTSPKRKEDDDDDNDYDGTDEVKMMIAIAVMINDAISSHPDYRTPHSIYY